MNRIRTAYEPPFLETLPLFLWHIVLIRYAPQIPVA